jgi:L-rhamnose mutarotase
MTAFAFVAKIVRGEPAKDYSLCTKGKTMRRVGFVLKVKADRLEEYKQHHKAVWPEMLDALRATGWHNYSLFMREDGLLFGYFETPTSLAEAQAGMAKTEVNSRWQEMMSPFFEIPEGAHPDQMFIELEEVFHLD